MATKLPAVAMLGIAFSLTSCLAGPHQLRRTIDDWENKTYVNSPLLAVGMWIVPVFPLLTAGAMAGDFLITDPYAFWFRDIWSNSGTGYRHYHSEFTNGHMPSLLDPGVGWLSVTLEK
ncbi:MAG: hypothetical protein IPK26_22690 [Planctomycetes bacterium]|nr:hypothetical protein [Planctomycetota bacterium]